MGFSFPANFSLRARGAGTSHSNRSDGLRTDALLADNSCKFQFATGYSAIGKKSGEDRQQGVLARLVSIVEPDEADALAQSLLRKFGSLGSVLSAPSSLIAELIGDNATAALLSVVKSTVLEGFREDIRLQIFDLEHEDFLQYIVGLMQGQREEILHAIFLDNFGRYLSDEIIAHGTWSEISVRLRSLLRRAIEVNCAKLVLFHNHPSGDCRPSNADVEFTLQARPIAGALGIDLFDHLVVSGTSVFSMRRAGLLT